MNQPMYWGRDPALAQKANLSDLGNFQKLETISAARTLTVGDSGSLFLVSGNGYTITLPSPSDRANVVLTFRGIMAGASNTVTLYTATGSINTGLSTGFSIALRPGDSRTLISDGTNWLVISDVGSAIRGTSGWQRLPSGVIIQWGGGTITSGGPTTLSLPTSFPTSGQTVVANDSGTDSHSVGIGFLSNSQIRAYSRNADGSTPASTNIRYIAIGY